jgi:hypothetical protein
LVILAAGMIGAVAGRGGGVKYGKTRSTDFWFFRDRRFFSFLPNKEQKDFFPGRLLVRRQSVLVGMAGAWHSRSSADMT